MSTEKDSSHDQEALAVLQTVYSHQLDSQDFGTLLQTLDEAIAGLTSAEFEADTIPLRLMSLESLDRHFELATRLDSQFSESNEERELLRLCEGPTACFAVNHQMQIVGVSDTCRERLGDIANRLVERLPLRQQDIHTLRETIATITGADTGRQRDRALFMRYDETDEIAIFRTRHFSQSRVVLISFDHLTWSDFVEDAAKRNFGLTDAECNVVRLLVAGQRPADIAESLGRSVETIRSQIKSVQSKTQIRDTSALIRMMCEIMTISVNLNVDHTSAEDMPIDVPQARAMTLSGLRYDVTHLVGLNDKNHATDKRKPAIFLHGLLQGPYLTKELRGLLAERRIEMVCPSRPGYGATQAATDKDQFIRQSLDQILHLLDAYRIDRADLVAHMVGMQFAARFADHAPDRVRSITGISSVIPMMSKAQLKQQNTMHRMAMVAARYSPAVLAYIAQIGERYLRDGNEIKCLKQLLARSAVDQRTLENPEYAALLKRGFEHLIGRGRAAFMHDCQSGIENWQDAFLNLACPVTFLHGAMDPGVPAQTLRAIAPRHENWTFKFFEDAGQTLLLTHPVEIADALRELVTSKDVEKDFVVSG